MTPTGAASSRRSRTASAPSPAPTTRSTSRPSSPSSTRRRTRSTRARPAGPGARVHVRGRGHPHPPGPGPARTSTSARACRCGSRSRTPRRSWPMRHVVRLRLGEPDVVPRVSDLEALAASTAGKVEIESLEDGRDEAVVERLIKAAVLTVFKARCPMDRFSELLLVFDEGTVVHAGDDVPSKDYVASCPSSLRCVRRSPTWPAARRLRPSPARWSSCSRACTSRSGYRGGRGRPRHVPWAGASSRDEPPRPTRAAHPQAAVRPKPLQHPRGQGSMPYTQWRIRSAGERRRGFRVGLMDRLQAARQIRGDGSERTVDLTPAAPWGRRRRSPGSSGGRPSRCPECNGRGASPNGETRSSSPHAASGRAAGRSRCPSES